MSWKGVYVSYDKAVFSKLVEEEEIFKITTIFLKLVKTQNN